MKDKARITAMVCTSAAGVKVPLAIIGKPKKSRSFRLSPGRGIPKNYKDQKNAWFDRGITKWWVWNVLHKHVLEKHGDVPFIIILDGCKAHEGIPSSELPEKCHFIFLPPNLTSRHQPADLGMISTLKVGYKTIMLTTLLDILDDPRHFERALREGKQVTRGLRGIYHASDPHLWDAISMLTAAWGAADENAKYAT